MARPTPRLPLNLDVLVRRRADPAHAVGLVVGFVFAPSPVALVRWRNAPESTFEATEDLVPIRGVER